MRVKYFSRLFSTLIFLGLSVSSTPLWSCTGIQLGAKDGSFINGRTVEFGIPLDLSGIVIPRNYTFKGTLPDGSSGLVYQTKYAAVGGGMYGENALADGLNEKGLSTGIFYFPGYAGYATITEQNKQHALSPTEFTNWILTQFATIDEVKDGLKTIVIAPTIPKGWPNVPPFHYVVYDKTGKSITIEPMNGELKIYDNPLGVMTNSPTFDWHMTNLANYINLSPVNPAPVVTNGVTLTQYGQGEGLHGLPGDFTSPSRFIRAAIFSNAAIPSATANDTVAQTFHILNQFDIPMGSVRDVSNKSMAAETTIATTVKDPQNLIYYFKTYDDQTIKMVKFSELDLNAKKISFISMKGPQTYLDVSKTAQ